MVRHFKILYIISSLILFTNCKKTEEKTEEKKVNTGNLIIWLNAQSSQKYSSQFISTLTVSVDGQEISTLPVSWYWNSTPQCNDDKAINTTIDLGSLSQKTVRIAIRRLDDKVIVFETTSSVKNGECTAVLIE